MDSGIIEERIVKNKQKRYFPTKQSQLFLKIKEDIVRINLLLDLIEKEPLVGDCFASDRKIEGLSLIHLTKKASKYLSAKKDNYRLFDFITPNKQSKDHFEVFSLMARQNIIKDLPVFLISYINNKQNLYPRQVKEEFIRMIMPILNRCLNILQEEYSESFSYSNSFMKESSKHIPLDSDAFVSVIKGNTTPDLILEFLKTLGRYSLCLSIKQELNKKNDFSKEKDILSSFIVSFFEPFLSKNIQEQNVAIIKNSVTGKILNRLIINTDLQLVQDYYIQYFKNLELFSKEEKELIRERKKNK